MRYIIGTRGSALALAQSEQVRTLLQNTYPQHSFTLQIIATKGDLQQHVALDQMDAKGIFVKEIEEALLAGKIHMAVHSLKDMPTQLPKGLCFTKTLLREDARDVFISRTKTAFHELGPQAKIGTGSKRRKVQLMKLRTDISVVGIRGNVDTRLRKMEEQQLDGIVLAAAGLKRLQVQGISYEYFPYTSMIPACGQGALAIEVKEQDATLLTMINALANTHIDQEIQIERTFLQAIDGGCHTPVGAHCKITEKEIVFDALYGNEDCSKMCDLHWRRPLTDAQQLPFEAAKYLIKAVQSHE